MNGSRRSLAKEFWEIEAALDKIESGDLGPGPWRIGQAECLAAFFKLPEGTREIGKIRGGRDPREYRCLPLGLTVSED